MFDEFMYKAAELRGRDDAFVVAIVVRSEAPISGKAGDKAIIHPDGRIWGWIGGACSQPLVIQEAMKALSTGAPRLIRISPSPDASAQEGVVDYTMTCHSGGSLDIYIEPVLPKPQLLILGRSLVAQTLARLAQAIDFRVTVAAPGATRDNFPTANAVYDRLDLSQVRFTGRTFIVVATQGESDEEALEQALAHESPYVAFVVSKTKREKVYEHLRGKGVGDDRLQRVRAPAGLAIGAVSPEEIAVSILAEVIQAGRKMATQAEPELKIADEVRDPVCGMTVDPARSKHKTELEGETYYFCCVRCKQTFEESHREVAGEGAYSTS
jgi:xanthine dehydrogenase accessory factor